MRNSREKDQIRKIKITENYCPNAFGSVLFEMENTRIICAVTVSEKVPDHADKKGMGWLTAEYTLMPYSTIRRTGRNSLKRDGRSVEIQRLIGRSFRGIIDLSKIKGYAITIDCDVIQADGGTRTAAITGGFIALKSAIKRMMEEGLINENPLASSIAAISVGLQNDELLLDIDYAEDSKADVDLNVVMDNHFNLIEIQGTGENSTFSIDQLNSMVALASKGIKELFDIQEQYAP